MPGWNTWNPVLQKVIEIKRAYLERFGEIDYERTTEGTCLERWVHRLSQKDLSRHEDLAEKITDHEGIEGTETEDVEVKKRQTWARTDAGEWKQEYEHEYEYEYEQMLSPLKFSQKGTLLLIHYGDYNRLFDGTGLDYSQFWDLFDGFYQECRGVVIDVKEETLVLTPFRKFWNLNEREETTMSAVQERICHARCVEFSEKLDGSMQCARWYHNELLMSGSMSIDPDNSWRLADGYRMLRESPGHCDMVQAHPEWTFVFEYISQKDAHIVTYGKEQEGLYLTGIREVDTGREFSYAEVCACADAFQVPHTRIYDKNLEQVVSELDDRTANEAEGFVLNIDGYKVKIKYNDYVMVHRTIDGLLSGKQIVISIAEGRFDDLLSKIPENYRKRVLSDAQLVYRYVRKKSDMVEAYYEAAPKEDRKTFMLWVTEHVPRELQGYCREHYLGHDLNFLKRGSEKCPSYTKMEDIRAFFD
ncbi:MAG: T4 RnlA family RNA ligase [Lachnospiraceae bacterium]|nr:T4 RnlA family RNA ligase [Lachnospiraceae bacterium]